MNRDPPDLKVVAARTEDEIERDRAIAALRWPTRETTANLLRVARGAGKPWALPGQIIRLAQTIIDAYKHGDPAAVVNEIEAVLWDAIPESRDFDRWDSHFPTVVRGSFQMAASKLLDQHAQEASGRREIREGIDEYERWIEQQREKRREEQLKYEAELRAARRLTRKPRKKPAPVRVKVVAKPQPKPALPPEKLPGESTAAFMKRMRDRI